MLIVDVNNQNSRQVVESSDLGKFSQIQSVAINSKCTTFGAASFDGRANLSNITKNVNGQFAPVQIYLFRKLLLLSKATNKSKAEILFFTRSTVFLSML